MSSCKGYQRHWFTDPAGNSMGECQRCGAPNPRAITADRDRDPTEFETKVLRRIARGHGHFSGGNKSVHLSAAARRLERLGYAAHPGTSWYATEKGKAYLDALSKKAADANQ